MPKWLMKMHTSKFRWVCKMVRVHLVCSLLSDRLLTDWLTDWLNDFSLLIHQLPVHLNNTDTKITALHLSDYLAERDNEFLTHPRTHSLTHSVTQPFTHSLTHSLIYSLTHPHTHTLTLPHSPTHTHSLTHSHTPLTHSYTYRSSERVSFSACYATRSTSQKKSCTKCTKNWPIFFETNSTVNLTVWKCMTLTNSMSWLWMLYHQKSSSTNWSQKETSCYRISIQQIQRRTRRSEWLSEWVSEWVVSQWYSSS